MLKKIFLITILQLIIVSFSCKNKSLESSTERKEEKHNIELWNGFYENMTIQDTAEHLRLLYPEYVEKTLKSFPDTEYLKENPNNDIYHQYHAEFLSKNHSSWNAELMGDDYDLLIVNNYLPPIDIDISHFINTNSIRRLVFYYYDIYLYGIRVEYTIDITAMVDDKIIEKYGESTKSLELGGIGMKMYYWSKEDVDVYYRNFQSYSMNGVLDIFSKSNIHKIQKELNHDDIINANIGL